MPTPPRQLHQTDRLLLLERDGWEFVERKKGKDAVAVIAVTDADEFVLVEQTRKPVDARVIDLPAGLIGDEDPHADASSTARKELEEEAGFTCEKIELLTTGTSSPGITSEKIVLVRASGLVRGRAGGGVGSEKITVHVVPLDGIAAWLRDREHEGRLVDMKVWAGLHFVTTRA
jgi:ADP-ribose pyrophosphatase